MPLLFIGTRGCYNEGFQSRMEILHPRNETLRQVPLVSGMVQWLVLGFEEVFYFYFFITIV